MGLTWKDVEMVSIARTSENICEIVFERKDNSEKLTTAIYDYGRHGIIGFSIMGNSKDELKEFLETNSDRVKGLFEGYMLGQNIYKKVAEYAASARESGKYM